LIATEFASSEVGRTAVRRAFAWRQALPRIGAVVLYAAAMAYVESAAVLYLRTIYGGVDPVAPRYPPLLPVPDFLTIEVGREAATMVMLACVGWLAGRGAAGRFGAFLLAFGVWDVGYYVFLWLFAGWPGSLFSPDVLFLLPLPWWGPVLTPMLIALLMAIGGAVAMSRALGDGVPRPDKRAVGLLLIGLLLCLWSFMFDALGALPRGLDAAFSVRGGVFAWPLYLAGLFCLAGAVWLLVARETPERPCATVARTPTLEV
jgi:hypothetical protein